MNTKLFYDRQQLTEREVTDNGYLKAPAMLARTGMYQYTGAELGLEADQHLKIFNVWRPEKEVFSRAALKSFSNLPVTNDHPKEMLNNKNTKKLGIGYSGDHIVKDGDFVRANLIITDKAAIDDIMDGKTEISLGYMADYRPAEAGEDCDFVQQKIRGNHIALVDGGRAGQECSIMDSNINIKEGVQNTMSKETNSMKEAKVDLKTDAVSVDPKSAKNEVKAKPSIKEMMQDEGVTLDQKVAAMFDHFMDALEGLKKPEKEEEDPKTGKTEEESEKKEGEPGKEKKKEMDSKDEPSAASEEAEESNKESGIDKKKESKDSIEALQAEIDTLRSAIPTADAVHALAVELTDVKEKAKAYAPSLTLDEGLTAQAIRTQVVLDRFENEDLKEKSAEYMAARFDSLAHIQTKVSSYMSSQVSKATRDRAVNARDVARKEMMDRKANAWKTKEA